MSLHEGGHGAALFVLRWTLGRAHQTVMADGLWPFGQTLDLAGPHHSHDMMTVTGGARANDAAI